MGPTEIVARRVRALRAERDWSAQQLADELNKIGVDWNRGVVSKLETGRRESVSVGELLALAYVLDVSPLTLLLPRENVEYRIAPELAELAVRVGRWLIGLRPLPLRTVDPDARPVHPGATAAREARFFSEIPAYLQSPPETVDEDGMNALRVLANALRRSGKDPAEILRVNTQGFIGDPERLEQVEAQLAELRERLNQLTKGGRRGEPPDQTD